TVSASMPHSCYPANGAEAVCKNIFTPALNIEYFLTEIFASANRRNSKEPNFLDACYIMSQIPGEYYITAAPKFIQRMLFPVLGNIGKALGLVKAKPLTQ